MEPSNQGEVKGGVMAGGFAARQPRLFCVTKTSKYFALALFIILPFLGGYVGYVSAPEKITEVDKAISSEERQYILSTADDSVTKQAIQVPPQVLVASEYGLYADKLVDDPSQGLPLSLNRDNMYSRYLLLNETQINGERIVVHQLNPSANAYLMTPNGGYYIGTRYGDCNIGERVEVAGETGSQITQEMKCWWAGAGSPLKLIDEGDMIKVYSEGHQECQNITECLPTYEQGLVLEIEKETGEIIADNTEMLGDSL